MKVLIVFVIGMFVSPTMPRVRSRLSKPWFFILVCLLVAGSFISLRVSG